MFKLLAVSGSTFGPDFHINNWINFLKNFPKTMEKVFENNHDDVMSYDTLRQMFSPLITPRVLHVETGFIKQNFGTIPYMQAENRFLLPQPGPISCTLACAWMNLLDMLGNPYPGMELYVDLNGNSANRHFQQVVSYMNSKDFKVYTVSFTTIAELVFLMMPKNSGAIGIYVNDDLNHWVMLDKVTKKKNDILEYFELSIRDPATCSFSILLVDSNMHVLSPALDVTKSHLIGDFTSIGRQLSNFRL